MRYPNKRDLDGNDATIPYPKVDEASRASPAKLSSSQIIPTLTLLARGRGHRQCV